MTFHEAQWAGLPEQGLWIESIAISPREEISPSMIEYKAITATGVESPWVTDGASCGTRGIGVPITGFALRMRPQAGAPQLSCEYGAICMSGTMIGPVRSGAPCSSSDMADPITAIWISISGKTGVAATATEVTGRSTQRPAKQTEARKRAATQPDTITEPPAKGRKSKIGPRFSVFREPRSSEHE
jgi:hypothetical protein